LVNVSSQENGPIEFHCYECDYHGDGSPCKDELIEFTRNVLGIDLQPYQEEFLRKSRGELRIRILRGNQEEAMAAFEELMRRKMEEED